MALPWSPLFFLLSALFVCFVLFCFVLLAFFVCFVLWVFLSIFVVRVSFFLSVSSLSQLSLRWLRSTRGPRERGRMPTTSAASREPRAASREARQRRLHTHASGSTLDMAEVVQGRRRASRQAGRHGSKELARVFSLGSLVPHIRKHNQYLALASTAGDWPIRSKAAWAKGSEAAEEGALPESSVQSRPAARRRRSSTIVLAS